jgi:hypothetical protein
MNEQFMKMTITKPMADKMLKNNNGNRVVKRAHVDFLKRQIKNGLYSFTGETIIIGASGNILDGQHRLTAVSECGIPITVLVATGIDDVARKDIDSGISRTLADRTCLPRNLCELIRSHKMLIANDAKKISAEEALRLYDAKQEHFDWAINLRPKEKVLCRAPIWVAFICYHEYSRDCADIFAKDFRKVYSEIQQAIVFKQWLYKSNSITGTFLIHDIFRRSLHCMNAHCIGRNISGVRSLTLGETIFGRGKS